jgi:uncharacterized membrane protein YuzA (DUF378 family)
VLAGITVSAVSGGSVGIVISVLSGHPPAMSLLFYSLAGCCGVLAFLWQAMAAQHRIT